MHLFFSIMIRGKFVHEFSWTISVTTSIDSHVFRLSSLVGSAKCARAYQWVSILALSVGTSAHALSGAQTLVSRSSRLW